jgi:hypothetical protein
VTDRPTLSPYSIQQEGIVNLKEHLQFLIMMIPTVLLLIAIAVSLTAPAKAAPQQQGLSHEELAVLETEFGRVQTAVVR